MSLWVECAYQSVQGSEVILGPEVGSRAIRTFQTKGRFYAVLVSCPEAGAEGEGRARQAAGRLADLLDQGAVPDVAVADVLAALPQGEYIPIAILQVLAGGQAHLVECDAPPLFLARRGRPVLLPVLEEEAYGRLLRRCEFRLQEGDHLAIVSEGYIQARGWDRRWGWRDIALSIMRLTTMGGDAEALLGALIRMYDRLAQGETGRDFTVLAMRVRPLRSLTLWSGPPADPALDALAVEKLLAGPGQRVICGGTTAEVAARVLGKPLQMEPRPAGGWAEVPPTLYLEGVDLVTEGVVTLRKARERLAGVWRARDLPRMEDGATRLARLLLTADEIHFLIGRAVNPAQMDGGVSWRQSVLEQLIDDLRAGGKIVSVEYVGQVCADV